MSSVSGGEMNVFWIVGPIFVVVAKLSIFAKIASCLFLKDNEGTK